VRALAYHSFTGNLDPRLNYKRIFQLLVGALTAGTGNRSDLETRIQSIIAEVSHSTDVILYIPEFQNIVGGSAYNLDLSGAILPYLKSGNLPIIATMSVGNYKTYMERNSLKEAFSVIQLKAPDMNTAVLMVLGESLHIEERYKIILSYRAIVKAVELSERFFQDQVLPGSAVSLLEAASNTVALSKQPNFEGTRQKIVLEEDVIKKVEEATHIPLSEPSQSETELLLHLEDRLHDRIVGQTQAVTAIAEAMRRVRSGMASSHRPISFLFLGPTGVGKTETAKALADFYFGGEKNIIRLDMSEYADTGGIKRLLGARPGEGTERGELTDKIRDNPSSLVLLDEFEKAHPDIHNLFLQVFDDGRLTDNKGQTVSFRNAIIIATSNAGSEFIREQVAKGAAIDKTFQQQLLDYLQTKAIFKPELLNRFDDVITFTPLGQEQVILVVRLLLNNLIRSLREQDITLIVQDNVIEKIAKEGFDRDFGARPLRRYIQDHIEDMIAQKKLTKEIDRGKVATFALTNMGEIQLTIS
jgi:ATP-dependent Clp protease ATP-binding subunit ClpC